MRRRTVSALLLLLVLGTLGAAFLHSISEVRRHRLRAVSLREQVAAQGRELCAARDRELGLGEHVDRLEAELHRALTRYSDVARTLDERRREREVLRDAALARRRAAVAPMPEGVRLALIALNELLRADGHDGIRFLWARSVTSRQLIDVELIEHDSSTLTTTAYTAGRVELEIDREAGSLLVRLLDGRMVRSGESVEFAEEGQAIVFHAVDGPAYERRLPYLVDAVGEYPADEPRQPAPRLDPVTMRNWLERVDRLLDLAETDLRYELARFRGLSAGRFAGVLLLAYDGGRTLQTSAEAKSLEILVDKDADIVALVLRNGILRTPGGETTIPEQGYQILLPGLRPKQAIDVMMGMVVPR